MSVKTLRVETWWAWIGRLITAGAILKYGGILFTIHNTILYIKQYVSSSMERHEQDQPDHV